MNFSDGLSGMIFSHKLFNVFAYSFTLCTSVVRVEETFNKAIVFDFRFRWNLDLFPFNV